MPFRKQRDYWLRPDGTKWGGEICPRSKIPPGSQSNLRRLSMRPQPFSSKLCLVLAVKQRRRNHAGDLPFFVVAALDTNYATDRFGQARIQMTFNFAVGRVNDFYHTLINTGRAENE